MLDPKYVMLMLFYTAHMKQQERSRVQAHQKDLMLLLCCYMSYAPRSDSRAIPNDDSLLEKYGGHVADMIECRSTVGEIQAHIHRQRELYTQLSRLSPDNLAFILLNIAMRYR